MGCSKNMSVAKNQRQKPRTTDYVSILSVLCEIFADFMFLEYWTGAL